MHAGARHLADGVQPGQRGRPVELRRHAAAGVVRRRGDGNPLTRRVDADRTARRRDRREALVEPLAHRRRVEVHVVVDTARRLRHAAADRCRDDVAWREILLRVHARHHAAAGTVVEDRPLAAYRLADERLLADGVRAAPHHRRVELHELDVAHVEAGPHRHGDAVAGDRRRVRRRREHLAVAAGREHHGTGPDDADRRHGAVGVEQRRCGRRPPGGCRPPSCRRSTSRAKARSSTSTPAARADWSSVRCTSAPLRSPPEWTMRRWLCPPSRASAGPSPPCA